ncbi:MAG: glutathione S-transferase [Moraxellaceae bacterium]|nr:glutathione S-transferase [Moraxellaceae bacterium]
MNELVGMYFSPWTERARWALDYHKVPYKYVEYTTLLGQPLLRLRAGKPFGKVSVPLLITPNERVNDSFEIAVYSDQMSEQEPLVPPAHFAEIKNWTESAELALYSARLRATRRIQASSEALADRLPGYTPNLLRKAFVPMAYIATGYILRKYQLEDDDDEKLLKNMDEFFDKANNALSGRRFVFENLSFADIVIATAMQAITPVEDKYIYLGLPSRKCMCEPALEMKYSSLIKWRDSVYEQYR